MIGLKKRDMRTILKAGAKARGLSLPEFRAEIQENIDNSRLFHLSVVSRSGS